MEKYLRSSIFVGLLLAVILASPLVAQEPEDLPLAARGSYQVSSQTRSFVDEARGGREIDVQLMYPALVTDVEESELDLAEQRHIPLRDFEPDTSGAPYPVVLYSHDRDGFP